MASTDVRLGFALHTGDEVRLPVRHLAITGQTQEAGKTTALEALIQRSGLRAVTFITKRGEGSFQDARRVRPYFRDEGDWQFVRSILEASRGERLKFETAWIIRASKGLHRLKDVHARIKDFLKDPKVKGLSADVYLTLDAYLDVVVPVIDRIDWASGLDLCDGVNAVDLSDVPDEMQHLVIRSCISWVLNREQHTVVVIPEAWKFLPQGRGTPVKLAAVAFIRQAAAMKNFLWLDSQDLGGIDKEILRSVPVWVLGVQREANEIKRTLENIPDGVAKPTRAAIATLDLGQFIACWGKQAIPTYVQPAWLTGDEGAQLARWVARGVAPASDVIARAPKRRGHQPKETTVTSQEAEALRAENQQLRDQNAELHADIHALTARLEALERKGAAPASPAPAAKTLTAAAQPAAHPVAPSPPTARREFTVEESLDNEALYQAFKARLLDEALTDPAVLKVLVTRPEVELTVTTRVIEVSEDSTRGLVAKLIVDGFFTQGQSSAATLKELQRRGKSLSPGTLYPELEKLAELGFFTIEDGKDERSRPRKEYHLVPGMRVNVKDGGVHAH